MPADGPSQRLTALEDWRRLVVDPWIFEHTPFLDQLAQDQTYRARYRDERSSRRARLRRQVSLATACAGAFAVLASSVLELIHLF